MKYRLNTTNYHDFATFAVNKLPARSYFIPYPGRAAADAVAPKQKRYASPKVQCLNGEWDFKFYPRPAELPVELEPMQCILISSMFRPAGSSAGTINRFMSTSATSFPTSRR